jgi:hypothetical protein
VYLSISNNIGDNMSEELYAVTNIEGYVTEMRQAAANSLSHNSEDNLDDYISLKQMINLVKSECVGFDDDDRPLLNEDANEKIYESTITWIHNIALAKLAAKDLVQCAWDNESNEMVFWANPDVNKSEKKKRNSNGQSNKRRNKKKDQGS